MNVYHETIDACAENDIREFVKRFWEVVNESYKKTKRIFKLFTGE